MQIYVLMVSITRLSLGTLSESMMSRQEHLPQQRAISEYANIRYMLSYSLLLHRVLQSQNETLQQTVKRMTSRIRDLEAALGKTQAQISPQPHPLLQESERLKEVDESLYEDSDAHKDSVEEASDLVGSLSIGDQGQARFHGQSSASEVRFLGFCYVDEHLLKVP